MKRWWSERTSRERVLIFTSALLIAMFVLYQGGVTPLRAFYNAAQQSHVEAQDYLADVEAAARGVHNLKAAAQGRVPLDDGGLRTAAAIVAKEVGISITRLQPLNDGAAEFWLDDVPAPQVYRWLSILNERHGIVITKADLRRSGENGAVRVQVAMTVSQTP